MEAEATCRHCHSSPETLVHQVLDCPALPTPRPLLRARNTYGPALIHTPFNTWLWTAPLTDVTDLLTAASLAGAYI
jgi:hypothetical protein